MTNFCKFTIRYILPLAGLLCLISVHAVAENHVIIKNRKPLVVKIPKPKNSKAEITFWNSIKHTNSKALYRLYISKYPNGIFVPAAINRIKNPVRPEKPIIVPRKRKRTMIIAG